MVERPGSLIDLLKSSPWPLNVSEIADVLECDESTAAMALKLLSDAGRARLNGDRWEIR